MLYALFSRRSADWHFHNVCNKLGEGKIFISSSRQLFSACLLFVKSVTYLYKC